MSEFNPYVGKPYSELAAIRKDYAKLLQGANAARREAQQHLSLIGRALEAAAEPRPHDASDHAVVRYLERVQGVNIEAIRETIAFNCEHGTPLIGDKIRSADGYLYCLNGDGFVTTVLPLGAIIEEASGRAQMVAKKRPSAKRRRQMRGLEGFVAIAMEARQGPDPEGLDGEAATARAEGIAQGEQS